MTLGIGNKELIVLMTILLIILGSKKLTEIAHNAGKTKKELDQVKKEIKELE